MKVKSSDDSCRGVSLSVVVVLLLAGVGSCVMPVASFAEETHFSEITPQALKQEIARLAQPNVGCSEKEAAEIAGRYGCSTIPTLVGMLTSPDCDPAAQGMACLVLARTPGSQGRDAIIAYAKRPLPAEMTYEQALGFQFAMVALAWKADEISLKCLEELVGRSYWEALAVKPVIHGVPRGTWATTLGSQEACQYLREMALGAGIGNVAGERQIEILRKVRAGGASDMAERIDFQIDQARKYIDSPPSEVNSCP